MRGSSQTQVDDDYRRGCCRFFQNDGSRRKPTFNNLKRCRAIIDHSIAEHSGRIFGAAGDSVIAEFASPVTAVLCANEFQQILSERNEQAGVGDRMQFRVGVNFGDVIIDGDNLYGDGVNVVARLECESEPGGVCLSAKVFDEVRRKLDLAFVDGGVRRLKNIDEPVPVFHLRTGGVVDGEALASLRPTPELASGGKPTVVVAPFKVIGQDADAEDLAIGLREDVIGGLARQSALSVV